MEQKTQDSQPETIITFPAICDEITLVQFAAQANQLFQAIKQPCTSILIDISNVDFAEPAFLVSLAALMQFVSQTFQSEKKFLRSRSRQVNNYMASIGFDQIFLQEQYDLYKPIWAAHSGLRQFQSADNDTIANCAEVLTKSCGYSFTNLYSRIEETFAELMANVSFHSESPVGGFVHMQYYPKVRRLRFSIADLGITIPKHLRRNPRIPEIWTDEQVLRAAAEIGVSGNPARFSGAGLHYVIELTQRLGGVVRIYSGAAMLVQTGDSLRTSTRIHPYPGTILTIDWPTV